MTTPTGRTPQPEPPTPTPDPPGPTPPKRRSRRRRLSAAVIRARRRAWRRGLLAWAIGFVLLAGLVLFLSGAAAWYHKLGVWVLLTLLADEAGGWFGYSGAVLGGVPFLAPLLPGADPAPAQWTVAYPLVLSALIACLLVKHAGGPLLAPLALAVFVAPLYLAKNYGQVLDTTVTLPGNDAFWRFAFGPAVLGLVIGVALAVARRLLRGPAEQQPRPA